MEFREFKDICKLTKENNEDFNYQKQIKLCPYETVSHRADIRQLFDTIESINPEARYSIWNALDSEMKLIEQSIE